MSWPHIEPAEAPLGFSGRKYPRCCGCWWSYGSKRTIHIYPNNPTIQFTTTFTPSNTEGGVVHYVSSYSSCIEHSSRATEQPPPSCCAPPEANGDAGRGRTTSHHWQHCVPVRSSLRVAGKKAKLSRTKTYSKTDRMKRLNL